MEVYDLCILGAGPGGISAAVRAARRGAKVVLADPSFLGGTCLNRGCIPARAMGTTAKLMAQLKKGEILGIRSEGGFQVDLAKVVARKNRIVRRLQAALSDLLSRSQVRWIPGEGILQGTEEVEIRSVGRPRTGIRAKATVLATGSRPTGLPNCPIDGEVVVTSDEILDLTELPESLLVIGAGVVGSEFASYFADLGSRVTLVEATDRVLPLLDERISEAFTQSLTRRGVTVMTSTQVERLERQGSQAKVDLAGGRSVTAACVLVATGRQAVLPKGSEGLGLSLTDGFLQVDDTLRSSVSSIFGIGDLLGEHQLACTASYEGAVAAENATGGSAKVLYDAVPDAIYTEPEIASVGLTEREAIAQGMRVTVSRLSLTGFARAQTFEETEGFVQVVAEEASGRLLGLQMIGARATDLVGEATLAIKHRLSLKDLTETLHGHPTMSESLWEAAAMALGQSIYYSHAAVD